MTFVLGFLCDLLFWDHLFLVSLLITIELWHRSPGDPHKWRFGPLWTFICFSRHYTGPATAQENKTEHSSGTAVAKCLSLTAALSFPEPALFQGGPCKKINIYLPKVFQPFGHKFQGNAREFYFVGFVSSARSSYCHPNLIHLPNTLQIT